MFVSCESWCFPSAWLLVKSSPSPLIPSVLMGVFKGWPTSVESNKYCRASSPWINVRLSPSLSLPVLKRKHSRVDGDSSHLLPILYVALGSGGSSPPALILFLLSEHFLRTVSVVITIATRCGWPTYTKDSSSVVTLLSHSTPWDVYNICAPYPDGWTEAQNIEEGHTLAVGWQLGLVKGICKYQILCVEVWDRSLL